MKNTRLASEFAAASRSDWVKLASAAGSAVSPLYEGFSLSALYDASEGTRVAYPENLRTRAGGAVRPWTVIQFVDHLDFADANRQLLDDLAQGARGLWLQLGGNLPFGGAYLGARTLEEFQQVFIGAPLTSAEIYISGGFDGLPGLALVAALADATDTPHPSLRGSAGLDPISIIAASGYIPAQRQHIMADFADAAWWLKAQKSGLTPFLASGRAWHQAGASAVQELAWTLAASVEYWRTLEKSGFTADEAIAAVDVILASECDLFLTIAKFRAARLLWAKAVETAGGAARPVKFLAEMSYRAISERDPHMNILRSAAAAFGASLGGAEAVLLIPFNTRAGTPDAFSRRMARNTQLVLMEEAHLGRVGDEAGGSWYVETLTSEIAARSWEEFRAIEACGGLLAALEQGVIYDAVAPLQQKRERNLSAGREAITGVSSFPQLKETPVGYHQADAVFDIESLNREGVVPDLPPAGKGERFAAMIEAVKSGATLRGIERALETVYERRTLLPATPERLAEPFEKLRRASDLALYRVGARPPVFVALLGDAADYTPRLTWLRSFFESGGVEVLTGHGFQTLDALQRAFRESPAPIACLCSTDKYYGALTGAADALKKAGAAALYVATQPTGLDSFNAADQKAIDRILYQGCDTLSLLSELHQIMRVEEMGSAAYEDYDNEEDG
ncbi:MAG: methylmalonyl-CoA mutase family protein [Hyphomicrobiales bacterium]|nr:methylmalonyl-CoA mutase family protein [Hyphomicrobiales bacterium]